MVLPPSGNFCTLFIFRLTLFLRLRVTGIWADPKVALYVADDGRELLMLLHLPSECWDFPSLVMADGKIVQGQQEWTPIPIDSFGHVLSLC